MCKSIGPSLCLGSCNITLPNEQARAIKVRIGQFKMYMSFSLTGKMDVTLLI